MYPRVLPVQSTRQEVSHRVDNFIQILPGVTKRYRGVAEVVAVEPKALEFSPNLVRRETKRLASFESMTKKAFKTFSAFPVSSNLVCIRIRGQVFSSWPFDRRAFHQSLRGTPDTVVVLPY